MAKRVCAAGVGWRRLAALAVCGIGFLAVVPHRPAADERDGPVPQAQLVLKVVVGGDGSSWRAHQSESEDLLAEIAEIRAKRTDGTYDAANEHRDVVLLEESDGGGSTRSTPVLVENAGAADLSAHVTGARSTREPFGEPVVEIELDEAGRAALARITGDNVNRAVAIIIDGRAVSAPVVRSAITGGKAQIMGHFTDAEREALVQAFLKAAAERK
jgi:preprotein translocase subunit SecD